MDPLVCYIAVQFVGSSMTFVDDYSTIVSAMRTSLTLAIPKDGIAGGSNGLLISQYTLLFWGKKKALLSKDDKTLSSF